MKNLGKKQKSIIIIFFIVILFFIYKYNNNENIDVIENSENIENNITSENTSDKNDINVTSKIVVHVSGAVNNEGVYELEENCRVADAIEFAGGYKENAYTKDINLAEKLEDGMKIYIQTKEEYEANKENSINNESTEKYTNNTSDTNKNKKININTATEDELESLPGIGPSTALKIVNYRKENGKFSKIEDIKNVSGIGESKFNQIKNLISV